MIAINRGTPGPLNLTRLPDEPDLRRFVARIEFGHRLHDGEAYSVSYCQALGFADSPIEAVAEAYAEADRFFEHHLTAERAFGDRCRGWPGKDAILDRLIPCLGVGPDATPTRGQLAAVDRLTSWLVECAS